MRTLCHAVAVLGLRIDIVAKIVADRVHPCVTAAGIEQEADGLRRRANLKLGVVATTGYIVDG